MADIKEDIKSEALVQVQEKPKSMRIFSFL